MANLRVYDPFADAAFDDLFKGFFKPIRMEGAVQPTMKLDVTENDKAYVVHAEIPGAKKEDVHVNIEGPQVTISAEIRRESEKKEGDRVLRSERYYGNVYRSFTLPVEIDEGGSEARYENGVLELRLSKRAPASGRKLQIS
jgi:HSP20 family protein